MRSDSHSRELCMSLVVRWSSFLPKQSQKSRSILQDGSRFLGLFRTFLGSRFLGLFRTFLPKQSQKSRSILQDGSRFLGLFRKGKTCIIAKLHWSNFVICSFSRERKTLSYSQINMVAQLIMNMQSDWFPVFFVHF